MRFCVYLQKIVDQLDEPACTRERSSSRGCCVQFRHSSADNAKRWSGDVRVAEGGVGSKVCLVTYGIHIGPQIDVFPCL